MILDRELSHDFLLIFALSDRQLEVFLSSVHFSHVVHISVKSISENFFLHKKFFLWTNSFSTSHFFRVVRPVIPILEHTLVVESSPIQLLIDLLNSGSCLTDQVICISFKKRSSHIWRVSVSEHRTPDQVSLLKWKQCIRVPQSFLTFRWMRPQTFLSMGLSVLCT